MKLDFIKIASVIKTHGYGGNIVLKKDESISSNNFDKCLKEGNAIFISKDGIPVPFFISDNSISFIDEQIVKLKLDEIDELEKAKCFIGNDVYLTANCIELEEDNGLPPSEWTDFKVIDKIHGFIGSVIQFNDDIPQNPLLIIEKGAKKLMIPVNGDLIQSVNINKKEIYTSLPEGYLDLHY